MASPRGLTLDEVLAEETVSAAHNWLCAQRKNYPQSVDI